MKHNHFLSLLFYKLASFIFRYRVIVLLSSIILVVISFFLIQKIRIDASLDALLPDDHHLLKTLDKANNLFGHSDNHIIVVKSPDFETGKLGIDLLVERMKTMPEIQWLAYQSPNPFFKKNILLYLDVPDLNILYQRLQKKISSEKSRARTNLVFDLDINKQEFDYKDILDKYQKKYAIQTPQKSISKQAQNTTYFHRYLSAQKQHVFVFFARPIQSSLNINWAKQLVHNTNQNIQATLDSDILKDKNISINITGRYQKKSDTIHVLQQDLKKITILVITGILVILLVYFRNLLIVSLLLVSLCVGILFTLGLSSFFISSLNLVSTFVIAIIFGLGVDFGIHFLVRFIEEISHKEIDVKTAFTNMLCNTGTASFLAASTSGFVFIVLLYSEFRAFAEFGLIASLSMLCTFMAYIIFMLPTMLILIDKFDFQFKRTSITFSPLNFLWKKPKVILWLSGILLTITTLGLPKLYFDTDANKLITNPHLLSFQLDKEISAVFNRQFTVPILIIANNKEHRNKIVTAIKKLKQKLHKDDPMINRVLTLDTFIPKDQSVKLNIIRKIRSLLQKNQKYLEGLNKQEKDNLKTLKDALIYQKITLKSLPEFIVNNLQGNTRGRPHNQQKILLYSGIDLEDGEEVMILSRMLYSLRIDNNPIEVASPPFILGEIITSIQKDGWLILSLVFMVIYFFSSFNLSSFKQGLIVFMPIVLGILYLLGIQGLFDVQPNILSIILYPIFIGVGIDSSIHLYYRYMEEGKKIKSAVNGVSGAIFLSYATTLTGFGVLLFANNLMIKSLGLLAIVGLTLILITTMIILPSFLFLLDDS